MTRRFNEYFHCVNCGMRSDAQSDFSRFVRECVELDSARGYVINDADYIIHRYKEDHDRRLQCLMMVEVKTHGAMPSSSQSDTLCALDQALRNRKTTPTIKRRYQSNDSLKVIYSQMENGWVRFRCFGMYLLKFSGNGPEDSDLIEWGRPVNMHLAEIEWKMTAINIRQMIDLLKFDLDPDTLNSFDLRIHHERKPRLLL